MQDESANVGTRGGRKRSHRTQSAERHCPKLRSVGKSPKGRSSQENGISHRLGGRTGVVGVAEDSSAGLDSASETGSPASGGESWIRRRERNFSEESEASAEEEEEESGASSL